VVEGGGYLSSLQPRLLAFFREAGVLIRPLGNTAYLMPPYCISVEDLARCHAVWPRRLGWSGIERKMRGGPRAPGLSTDERGWCPIGAPNLAAGLHDPIA
jgi:hypothetical protein